MGGVQLWQDQISGVGLGGVPIEIFASRMGMDGACEDAWHIAARRNLVPAVGREELADILPRAFKSLRVWHLRQPATGCAEGVHFAPGAHMGAVAPPADIHMVFGAGAEVVEEDGGVGDGKGVHVEGRGGCAEGHGVTDACGGPADGRRRGEALWVDGIRGKTGGLDNADIVDSRRRVGTIRGIIPPIENQPVDARIGDVDGNGEGVPSGHAGHAAKKIIVLVSVKWNPTCGSCPQSRCIGQRVRGWRTEYPQDVVVQLPVGAPVVAERVGTSTQEEELRGKDNRIRVGPGVGVHRVAVGSAVVVGDVDAVASRVGGGGAIAPAVEVVAVDETPAEALLEVVEERMILVDEDGRGGYNGQVQRVTAGATVGVEVVVGVGAIVAVAVSGAVPGVLEFGGVVEHVVLPVVDGEVEGDGAVAAEDITSCTSGTSRTSVVSPAPQEAVAGGGDGVAVAALAKGEVEGHHAVAARGVGGGTSGTSGTSVTSPAPQEAVAGGGDGVAMAAVAKGEVERHGAVASVGICEREGRTVVAGGVGDAVDPGVSVARCNGIRPRGGVVDGEVEGVAAEAFVADEGVVGVGARGAIFHAVPGVALTGIPGDDLGQHRRAVQRFLQRDIVDADTPNLGSAAQHLQGDIFPRPAVAREAGRIEAPSRAVNDDGVHGDERLGVVGVAHHADLQAYNGGAQWRVGHAETCQAQPEGMDGEGRGVDGWEDKYLVGGVVGIIAPYHIFGAGVAEGFGEYARLIIAVNSIRESPPACDCEVGVLGIAGGCVLEILGVGQRDDEAAVGLEVFHGAPGAVAVEGAVGADEEVVVRVGRQAGEVCCGACHADGGHGCRVCPRAVGHGVVAGRPLPRDLCRVPRDMAHGHFRGRRAGRESLDGEVVEEHIIVPRPMDGETVAAARVVPQADGIQLPFRA